MLICSNPLIRLRMATHPTKLMSHPGILKMETLKVLPLDATQLSPAALGKSNSGSFIVFWRELIRMRQARRQCMVVAGGWADRWAKSSKEDKCMFPSVNSSGKIDMFLKEMLGFSQRTILKSQSSLASVVLKMHHQILMH